MAGVGFALLELAWGLAHGHALFLSHGERGSYAALALSALPALVVATGLILRPALAPSARLVRVAYAALWVGGVARAVWLLTEGRRVRDLPLRPLIVAVVALVAGYVAFRGLEHAAALRSTGSHAGRRRFVLVAAPFVAALLATDALLLPRGYPPFHASLALLALVAAGLVGLLHPWQLPERFRRGALGAAGVCALLAPFALLALAAEPNASFAVNERGPWSGKLLRLLSLHALHSEGPGVGASAHEVEHTVARGVDLRDHDVLLITVDALRADAVGAYGGTRTPEIDRLAAEGVVFRRAYTPTPNTSYALTSLLTAKFMKPVIELPGAGGEHTTLPDILRRYGYRTAAFIRRPSSSSMAPASAR